MHENSPKMENGSTTKFFLLFFVFQFVSFRCKSLRFFFSLSCLIQHFHLDRKTISKLLTFQIHNFQNSDFLFGYLIKKYMNCIRRISWVLNDVYNYRKWHSRILKHFSFFLFFYESILLFLLFHIASVAYSYKNDFIPSTVKSCWWRILLFFFSSFFFLYIFSSSFILRCCIIY